MTDREKLMIEWIKSKIRIETELETNAQMRAGYHSATGNKAAAMQEMANADIHAYCITILQELLKAQEALIANGEIH